MKYVHTYCFLIACILGSWSYATTDSFNLKYYTIKDAVLEARLIESAHACASGTGQNTERKEIVRDRKEDGVQKQAVQKNIVQCNVKCKIDSLIDAGMKQELAILIVNTCKGKATNPIHCIKTASFISWAESRGGNASMDNPFGYRNTEFENAQFAMNKWITSYNKYWYKTSGPSEFYSGTSGVYPRTRYCVDEGNLDYCPNGHKNSWSFFNKITF